MTLPGGRLPVDVFGQHRPEGILAWLVGWSHGGSPLAETFHRDATGVPGATAAPAPGARPMVYVSTPPGCPGLSVRVELARGHLLCSGWLRRVDAHEPRRTVHRMLTAMGIEGFAERARRHLGKVFTKPGVSSRGELRGAA
jgi:hypothetical protein